MPSNLPQHPADKPIRGIGTSPKTTLAGYLLGGSALLAVAGQIVQSFPEGGGAMDVVRLIYGHWEAIGTALAAMGIGYLSRDNDKSSEKAGAK